MARQKRCFLSSTLEDLRVERLAVRDAIERAGFLPVMMESFTTDSRPPSELLTDLVDSSSVLLLVIGTRLGSRDRVSRRYFVQVEYERAIAAGIQVHVFLSGPDRLVPDGQRPKTQTEQKELTKFRAKLQADHTVRMWSDAAQLKHEVFVALSTRRAARRKLPVDPEPSAAPHTANRIELPTPALSENLAGEDFSPLSPVVGYVQIVSWYERHLFAFDEIREQLERHVRSILVTLITTDYLSEYSVYSRTKKPASLQANLERPRRGRVFKVIEDVHDLIGLRVVVLHEIEVGKVSAELLARLPGSTLEVKEPSDPLSFGYRSYHILSPLETRIAGKAGFRFEIQIRTFLQHTWAQIEHKLGYKATVYDDISRRLFAQVSALLEIADGKFSELKQRQQSNIPKATHDVPKGPRRRAEDQLDNIQPTLLTEDAVISYFGSDLWDSSKLLGSILDSQYAFSVMLYENGGTSAQNWSEPLYLLGTSEISTVEALHDYFESKSTRFSTLISSIGTRIEFSSVTPLLLLWIAALMAHADSMTHSPAAEVRALLEQYSLFPEDDRDAVSDLIAIRRYIP